MLIETMYPHEITAEIFNDWSIVTNSLERLHNEYNKQRRKNKVPKDKTYSVAYDIKTKKKNTWIFILSKAPSIQSYKGLESVNACCLVYYYNSEGIRVFKVRPEGGLSVYNGHLFTRYNERMSLDLDKSIDIVKHFFINNGYSTSQILPKEGRDFFMSTCKDGLLLGELQEERSWMVNKTFINRDQLKPSQDELEVELIKSLQVQIETELNKPEFNKMIHDYKTDVIKGILS